MHQIEDLVEELGEIHIIALTETRIFAEQNKYFNINNFTAYFNNRLDGEGGVALYIHDSLSSFMIESFCDHNVHRLIVNLPDLSVNLAICYKQPSAIHSVLIDCINSILGGRKRLILLGDMNIDLLRPDNRGEEYANTVLGHGYSILNKIDSEFATRVGVRHYERYGVRTSKTIIDHFISDLHNFNFNISAGDTPMSDHKQVILSFNDNSNRKIHFASQSVNSSFDYIDQEIYESEFNSTNWNDVSNFDDFLGQLSLIRDNSVKTFKKNNRKNPFKPWVKEELLSRVEERNRYYKLLKKSPTNEYLKVQHENLNSVIKSLRSKLRREYNEREIKNNSNNPKRLWLTINEILSNKKKGNLPIKAININTTPNPVTDPLETARLFNSYFCSVGKLLF